MVVTIFLTFAQNQIRDFSICTAQVFIELLVNIRL